MKSALLPTGAWPDSRTLTETSGRPESDPIGTGADTSTPTLLNPSQCEREHSLIEFAELWGVISQSCAGSMSLAHSLGMNGVTAHVAHHTPKSHAPGTAFFPRSHSSAYLVRCVFQIEGVFALGPVICLAPSMRVAAERARNRFRHRHRPQWRRHSRNPGYDRQPKHWIKAGHRY